MLEAMNISLVYRNGEGLTNAVDDVSLRIAPGEFFCIVGPSGSGKSSLLYLLSGLKPISAGRICFEGRDYGELRNGKLTALRRKRFGFIFQQHFLINYLTVLENVLVAASARDRATVTRAKELLEELGLEKILKRRPWQLSIGQRQRVAIARALINDPAIVFADEPTASLDHATGYQVVDLLARHRGTGSVVFVTHDPEMLSAADRVIRMRDGRIVAEP